MRLICAIADLGKIRQLACLLDTNWQAPWSGRKVQSYRLMPCVRMISSPLSNVFSVVLVGFVKPQIRQIVLGLYRTGIPFVFERHPVQTPLQLIQFVVPTTGNAIAGLNGFARIIECGAIRQDRRELKFATTRFLTEFVAMMLSRTAEFQQARGFDCLLYTSPSPRDQRGSRMPSSA